MSQPVEHLLYKYKALSSNPNPAKNKQTKKQNKQEMVKEEELGSTLLLHFHHHQNPVFLCRLLCI
jgi:hypothetical protein